MSRVCACGCGAPLEGMRKGARWLTPAHAVRWSREHGKPRRLAEPTTPRRRSGRQVSFKRAVDEIAALLLSLGIPDAPTVAEEALSHALPSRQRRINTQERGRNANS